LSYRGVIETTQIIPEKGSLHPSSCISVPVLFGKYRGRSGHFVYLLSGVVSFVDRFTGKDKASVETGLKVARHRLKRSEILYRKQTFENDLLHTDSARPN